MVPFVQLGGEVPPENVTFTRPDPIFSNTGSVSILMNVRAHLE